MSSNPISGTILGPSRSIISASYLSVSRSLPYDSMTFSLCSCLTRDCFSTAKRWSKSGTAGASSWIWIWICTSGAVVLSSCVMVPLAIITATLLFVKDRGSSFLGFEQRLADKDACEMRDNWLNSPVVEHFNSVRPESNRGPSLGKLRDYCSIVARQSPWVLSVRSD